jgi:hypothetical protein
MLRGGIHRQVLENAEIVPSGASCPDFGSRSLVSRLLALQMLGAIIIYLIVNIGLGGHPAASLKDNLETGGSVACRTR